MDSGSRLVILTNGSVVLVIARMNKKERGYMKKTSRYKVTFESIGEGYSGDYNENDPTDQPLLRFSCEKKVGRSWEYMDSASYCTCLTEATDKKKLNEYSKLIVKCLEDTEAKGESYRRELERFSWLGN